MAPRAYTRMSISSPQNLRDGSPLGALKLPRLCRGRGSRNFVAQDMCSARVYVKGRTARGWLCASADGAFGAGQSCYRRRMQSGATPASFPHRHLLGIEGLTRPDIVTLLDMAEEAIEVSRRVDKKRSSLRGRTQINLFYESSTRTQASFEIAGKRLGADVMNMSVARSSESKGRDADRHGGDAQRHAAGHHRGSPCACRRGASSGAQGRLFRRQRRRRRA